METRRNQPSSFAWLRAHLIRRESHHEPRSDWTFLVGVSFSSVISSLSNYELVISESINYEFIELRN